MYVVNLIGTMRAATPTHRSNNHCVDLNDNAPVFADGATDTVSVNEGGTTVGDYNPADAEALTRCLVPAAAQTVEPTQLTSPLEG
ncbi:MAG: hypothetical protein CM1200mP32_01520 [Methanobacteriota archaeon]|nr:MAG: hypothetical protein CM1200mP32_01520 [Euryarchaeota archaeon]